MRPTRLTPLLAALALLLLGACGGEGQAPDPPPAAEAPALRLHYLEIVTPEVDATCATLEALHGVRFGAPEPALGNARTAPMRGGGRLGVRAPLRADEAPVVRPYLWTDDVAAAVPAAQAAGGALAMDATELPGLGRFALYVQGGIEFGLWGR